MASFHGRYITGEYEQVWNELCLLGPDVRKPPYFDDAKAVARETMRRVRSNCETLIPRLEGFGWRFGYEWARIPPADSERVRVQTEKEIARQPPLLGEPTPTEVLDNIEANNGLLPLSLRSFYEVVGAINFVGTPFNRPDWPGVEDGLDPLYIAGVEQAFGHRRNEWDEAVHRVRTIDTGDALLTPWPGQIEIAPCFLHKYFISGVGSVYIEMPAAGADTPVMFEDGPLQVEGHDLMFVQYLRYAMRGGGLLAFWPGWEPLVPDHDLAYITEGLWAI
jgi:hypothetical protein